MKTDELVAALQALGSKDAAAAVEDVLHRVAVLEERLAKAVERESKLREEIALVRQDAVAAKRETNGLREQVDQMVSHPEVRAAKRAKLAEQAADLERQVKELTDPPAPKKDD